MVGNNICIVYVYVIVSILTVYTAISDTDQTVYTAISDTDQSMYTARRLGQLMGFFDIHPC